MTSWRSGEEASEQFRGSLQYDLWSRALQRIVIEPLAPGMSASLLPLLRHGKSVQRHDSSIFYFCTLPSLNISIW